MKEAKPVIIPGMVSAVNKIAYAMAETDVRPVLMGMSMKFLDKEIELCAADGFRLGVTRVRYTTAHEFKKEEPRQFILPREAVLLFKHFEKDKVVMCIGNNCLRFSTPEVTIGTMPIQGSYPDYCQLYPDTKKYKALSFDRNEMLVAVKAVIKQKDFKTQPLRLYTPRGGGVKIFSQDGDGHSLEFTVPGRGSGKIAFNPSLLRDMVQTCPGPNVTLKTASPDRPALVKMGHDIHLLMPMYVQWQKKK